MSTDFREHAVANLVAELFELHDRKRFEVYGFSYGPDDRSAMRQRISKSFDRFFDLRDATDEQFASRIDSSAIDILIDLNGHTDGARLGVLAKRLSPVQCHFLGFPGTTGISALDYFVTDSVTSPAGSDAHFTEHLVRLPPTYQVNDRKRPLPVDGPTREQCGLPPEAIVLCSFNGQQKLRPWMLDIWGRILAAVPQTVLWLYADNEVAASNLRAEVARRGIDPARLIIAGKVPLQQHLARQPLADLFLDTLPYNGHTTGSDALWCGLPVLTCPGRTFAARVGAGLLSAMGMPELIAADLADYEAKAIALARDPAKLAELRGRLIDARKTAALFDTDAFRRKIEAAYMAMWDRHVKGLPCAAIDIGASSSEPASD